MISLSTSVVTSVLTPLSRVSVARTQSWVTGVSLTTTAACLLRLEVTRSPQLHQWLNAGMVKVKLGSARGERRRDWRSRVTVSASISTRTSTRRADWARGLASGVMTGSVWRVVTCADTAGLSVGTSRTSSTARHLFTAFTMKGRGPGIPSPA